jgi:hypothetical protein
VGRGGVSPKLRAPHTWRSGHCGIARHAACRGAYGGADCSCRCHTEPEPVAPTLDLPDLPSLLHDGSPACPTCGRPWASSSVFRREPLAVVMDTGGASGQW